MLHCTTLEFRPWSSNSFRQKLLAKKPRSSPSLSGSIMNAPSSLVSMKIICGLFLQESHNSHFRDGNNETSSSPPKFGLLMQDFIRKIPREQQDMIGHRFQQFFRRINRQVDARHVAALLIGAAVRHEIQRFPTYPEAVEERAALGRRAVGSQAVPFSLQRCQQGAERLFHLFHPSRKILVVFQAAHTPRRLMTEQRARSLAMIRSGGFGDKEAEGASVDGATLHILNDHPMTLEEASQGRQRKVAQVLVVNCVKLAVINHVLDVRHLDDRHTVVFQEQLEPANESIQILHMRHHVVRMNDVRLFSASLELFGQLLTEKFTQRGDTPFCLSNLGDIDGGLDPKNRNPLPMIVLEQIPIIAPNLYHQALGVQPARFAQTFDKLFSMPQKCLGK